MKAPDQQIINRTLDNTATPEEARIVLHWFATPEGKAYLEACMERDSDTIQPGKEELFAGHPIPSDEMYRYIMNRVRWQRRRRLLFRAAAILLPLLLLTGQFWYFGKQIDLFGNTGYEEISVPRGERMQIVFQDGSKATLNAESHIRYPLKFGLSERRVELEGEAFFEISPNKKRPFIVDLQEIEVKVVGTSFNVKAYQKDPYICVSLETGKLFLESMKTTNTLLADLKPGERATYNRQSGKCEVNKSSNITDNSAWKNNVVIFDNIPLKEILHELSRKYDVDFEVADSTALDYTYTLTSTPGDIWDILYDLQKVSPVRFERQENKWVVRRNN